MKHLSEGGLVSLEKKFWKKKQQQQNLLSQKAGETVVYNKLRIILWLNVSFFQRKYGEMITCASELSIWIIWKTSCPLHAKEVTRAPRVFVARSRVLLRLVPLATRSDELPCRLHWSSCMQLERERDYIASCELRVFEFAYWELRVSYIKSDKRNGMYVKNARLTAICASSFPRI